MAHPELGVRMSYYDINKFFSQRQASDLSRIHVRASVGLLVTNMTSL